MKEAKQVRARLKKDILRTATGTVFPLDKIFGTHHDGTREAQIAMRERLAAMRRARKEA